jgi:hypothetical protein
MTDDDFSWINNPIFTDAETPDFETTRNLKKPLITGRKLARRKFINGLKKEALNQLIPTLPPPDTDLYIVGNGAGAEIRHGIDPLAFDFGTFIPHVVDMLGGKACIAYVSTWSMNRNHTKTMLDMLKSGALQQLTVFTDPYFKRREAAIAAELINGLLDAGQRYLAFKNHCKIIAIAAPGDRTCVITGSANLSAQPRCENYNLTTSPDVYQFYRDEFFETMIHASQSD